MRTKPRKTMAEIRQRLYELAKEYRLDELRQLANMTKRRNFGRKARTEAKPITQNIVNKVRLYDEMHPDISQREIAELHGINQGRVNEILHGFRDGTTWEDRLRQK